MIDVEVLIDNFLDKENQNKKLQIMRNNKVITLNEGDLLKKGDRYKISKSRFDELSEKKIVTKAKKIDKED